MNKKSIILLGGVIVFLIIFAAVLFFQTQSQTQTPPTPSSLHSQNPAALQQTSQNKTKVTPVVTLAPLTGTAQEVARQFYEYYFSTPENPLAAGKYKTNPYLSQYFKENIETGYNNGNGPIFCPQNKEANIIVGKEVQVYRANQYMRMETISEAPPGKKDLYTILLSNNNGQWLVEDVNCL